MNEGTQAGSVTVTGSMVESMRATKPWTKLVAILGFIGVGFMVLVGLGVMAFGGFFPAQQGAPPVILGLFYLVFSVLYFMPAFYLYRYASAIGRFLETSGTGDLESAFSHQRSFWKFVGIMALVGIVVGVLGIAAAIAIPLMVKMRMQQGM